MFFSAVARHFPKAWAMFLDQKPYLRRSKKEMYMKTEMDPAKTSRGAAFALLMKSPMPMVTLTKTMDVSRLVRFAKRHNYPFNMLLCWCIAAWRSSTCCLRAVS